MGIRSLALACVAMVLLAGLGNTAHVFDEFALRFTSTHHVYGITRRGFGASSTPSSGYAATRMGDDILAVRDSLNLSKPILVGHSGGGSEMISIATGYSERGAAGLQEVAAGRGHGSAPEGR